MQRTNSVAEQSIRQNMAGGDTFKMRRQGANAENNNSGLLAGQLNREDNVVARLDGLSRLMTDNNSLLQQLLKKMNENQQQQNALLSLRFPGFNANDNSGALLLSASSPAAAAGSIDTSMTNPINNNNANSFSLDQQQQQSTTFIRARPRRVVLPDGVPGSSPQQLEGGNNISNNNNNSTASPKSDFAKRRESAFSSARKALINAGPGISSLEEQEQDILNNPSLLHHSSVINRRQQHQQQPNQNQMASSLSTSILPHGNNNSPSATARGWGKVKRALLKKTRQEKELIMLRSSGININSEGFMNQEFASSARSPSVNKITKKNSASTSSNQQHRTTSRNNTNPLSVAAASANAAATLSPAKNNNNNPNSNNITRKNSFFQADDVVVVDSESDGDHHEIYDNDKNDRQEQNNAENSENEKNIQENAGLGSASFRHHRRTNNVKKKVNPVFKKSVADGGRSSSKFETSDDETEGEKNTGKNSVISNHNNNNNSKRKKSTTIEIQIPDVTFANSDDTKNKALAAGDESLHAMSLKESTSSATNSPKNENDPANNNSNNQNKFALLAQQVQQSGQLKKRQVVRRLDGEVAPNPSSGYFFFSTNCCDFTIDPESFIAVFLDLVFVICAFALVAITITFTLFPGTNLQFQSAVIATAVFQFFTILWVISRFFMQSKGRSDESPFTPDNPEGEWEICDKSEVIRAKYFKFWFWFDLLYAFPLEFVFIFRQDWFFYAMVRHVLRALRVRTVGRSSNPLVEERRGATVLASYAALSGILVHLSACLFVFFELDVSNPDRNFDYLDGLHWSVQLFSSVGATDWKLSQQSTQVLAIFSCIAGIAVVALSAGLATQMLTEKDLLEEEQGRAKKMMYSMLRHFGIPWNLQKEIILLFPAVLKAQSEGQFREMIRVLPSFLGEQVEGYLRAKMLAKVPLFADLDEEIVLKLSRTLEQVFAAPYEYIIHAGEVGSEMYMLVHGVVEALIPINDEEECPVATLRSGSYFGEIALIEDSVRTASVQAITACDLLVLDKTIFKEVVAQHPELQERIRREIENRRREMEKKQKSSDFHNLNRERRMSMRFGTSSSIRTDVTQDEEAENDNDNNDENDEDDAEDEEEAEEEEGEEGYENDGEVKKHHHHHHLDSKNDFNSTKNSSGELPLGRKDTDMMPRTNTNNQNSPTTTITGGNNTGDKIVSQNLLQPQSPRKEITSTMKKNSSQQEFATLASENGDDLQHAKDQEPNSLGASNVYSSFRRKLQQQQQQQEQQQQQFLFTVDSNSAPNNNNNNSNFGNNNNNNNNNLASNTNVIGGGYSRPVSPMIMPGDNNNDHNTNNYQQFQATIETNNGTTSMLPANATGFLGNVHSRTPVPTFRQQFQLTVDANGSNNNNNNNSNNGYSRPVSPMVMMSDQPQHQQQLQQFQATIETNNGTTSFFPSNASGYSGVAHSRTPIPTFRQQQQQNNNNNNNSNGTGTNFMGGGGGGGGGGLFVQNSNNHNRTGGFDEVRGGGGGGGMGGGALALSRGVSPGPGMMLNANGANGIPMMMASRPVSPMKFF